jgi:hypothetical protein
MNSLINSTDYRIAFATDSVARHYLIQTGSRNPNWKFIPVDIPDIDSYDLPRISRSYSTPDPKHLHWRHPRFISPPSEKTTPSTPPPLKHLSTIVAVPLFEEEEEEEEEEQHEEVEIALSEVGFEISVSTLTANHLVNHLKHIPQSYYAGLRSRGITRLILTGLPDDGNLEELEEICNSIGLIVSTGPPNSYSEDPELRKFLIEGNIEGFLEYLKTQSSKKLSRILHNSIWDSNPAISVSLLMLPGLKIIRDDPPVAPALLVLLAKETVRLGKFSIPEIHLTEGEIAAWKYSMDFDHVLVCANPLSRNCVGAVICSDCGESGKVKIFEWFSELTFNHEEEELRTRGLKVILQPGEVQIFEY